MDMSKLPRLSNTPTPPPEPTPQPRQGQIPDYGRSRAPTSGIAEAWQEIERQVERLGFGDNYAVSRTRGAGANRERDLIRVSPVRMRSDG